MSSPVIDSIRPSALTEETPATRKNVIQYGQQNGLGAMLTAPPMTQSQPDIGDLENDGGVALARIIKIKREARLQGPSTQLRVWDAQGAEAANVVVRTIRSRWFDYVEDRFDRIKSRVDHNDPDRLYPTLSIVAKARDKALSLFSPETPTPSVVPSDGGGIVFVWHKGGLDVEFEVNEHEETVWVYVRDFEKSYYGSLVEQYGLLQVVLQYLAQI